MDYFSDEFLAYLELKQDMLFHKIPVEDIWNYLEKSLEIGKSFVSQLKSKDIFELYAESDIRIKEEKHDGVFYKVQMRAQFESDHSFTVNHTDIRALAFEEEFLLDDRCIHQIPTPYFSSTFDTIRIQP